METRSDQTAHRGSRVAARHQALADEHGVRTPAGVGEQVARPADPGLGDAQHGFPYLSGRGRLVVKDAIMMGAAIVTMADSAKAYLRKTLDRDTGFQPVRAVSKRAHPLVARTTCAASTG